MKVSVIVPVYNVKDYLRRSLDSVVNQTLRDIEIIIVDDGSTDGSSEIVDEYAKIYGNVNVIHKNNGGLMSAWTTGVRASSGEYIGFIDSDDYAAPDMYENLYAKAVGYDVDIVISNYIIDGKITGKHPIKEGKYTGKELYDNIKKHIFPSPYTYSLSMSRMPKIYKRHIILDNLKYTESLSRTFEDRYIVPAAILSAQSVYYTKDAYYCWMLREDSNHGMYKQRLLDDIKRVYDVQHQVVLDKCPELESKWEEAYLDFIRLYVFRNIIRVKDFRTKYISAKNLLDDPLTKDRLSKYGRLCKDKTGMALNLSYKIDSPALLAITSYLGSRKG